MSEEVIDVATEATTPAPDVVVSTRDFVTRQVDRLQGEYLRPHPTSWSRATLAQLRRGVGKPVGELLDLLPLVVNPDAPRPRGEEPTADEIAIYTALTLYAVHQQSQRTRMHVPRASFGTALGGLRYAGGTENPGIVRRFQALGTASNLDELVYHARTLVTLLRSGDRGFDYGRFADDLVAFQDPRRRDFVRLAWGRDFYRVAAPSPAA